MFNNWLRTNKVAMWLLTIVRIYLGYQWMTHGIEKLTKGFDAGGFLQGAIAKSTGENPAVQAWWASFLQHAALPGVKFFNVLIPAGEFLVGLGLILGTFTTFAALMAVVMNTAFLFSGTVSTNAQMLLLEIFLVVAAANAGKIGLDRWVMPFLRGLFKRNQAGRGDGGETQAPAPAPFKTRHTA
ncbi:DoxX family protein [Paenibacillus pinistramenti]|uniref:DoxX family protein n=1 Tax=Paenibacillus pinistramenti TaxID=1768003 RepID=UPI001108B823|nr:DoxX family protein [Paenibacillus pinistramenti]